VPDYKLQLGKTIARRRRELGITQRELADRAGVREASTVSRWERGERAPNDLEVVARALESTAVEMLAGITQGGQASRRSDDDYRAQLDRIEGKLDELLAILLGPRERAERELERLAARARSRKAGDQDVDYVRDDERG
jgi:transcriptional regulator with XRE-family HTH domain